VPIDDSTTIRPPSVASPRSVRPAPTLVPGSRTQRTADFEGALQAAQQSPTAGRSLAPVSIAGTAAPSADSVELAVAYAQLEQASALASLLTGSASDVTNPLMSNSASSLGLSSLGSLNDLLTSIGPNPVAPVSMDGSPDTNSGLTLSALLLGQAQPPSACAPPITGANTVAAVSAYISAAMGVQVPSTANALATELTRSGAPTGVTGMTDVNSSGPTPSIGPNPGLNASLSADSRQGIQNLINQIAPNYGLDPTVVRAVVQQESDYSPIARSDAGAMGLMQLMPSTAAELGITDPFNVEQNLRGGMTYLSNLLEQYKGDLPLALAAYNAGPSAVAAYGGIPPYPQTQSYVAAIMQSLESYDK